MDMWHWAVIDVHFLSWKYAMTQINVFRETLGLCLVSTTSGFCYLYYIIKWNHILFYLLLLLIVKFTLIHKVNNSLQGDLAIISYGFIINWIFSEISRVRLDDWTCSCSHMLIILALLLFKDFYVSYTWTLMFVIHPATLKSESPFQLKLFTTSFTSAFFTVYASLADLILNVLVKGIHSNISQII